MRRPAVLALFFAGYLTPSGIAVADTSPKIGETAPALSLKTLLQAPADVHGNWDELRGKAVVLEFWATWCGGCVDNIPHLNELAEQFQGKPIQFISITDETDVDHVKEFLKRHPIAGWIGFDLDEGTFKRFGVEARPRTVLVDANGKVRAITNPLSLTSSVLDDLIGGKALNFPEVAVELVPLGEEPGAPPPLIQVLIRPVAPEAVSKVSPGWATDKAGRYDEYGIPLTQLLSENYGFSEDLLDAPGWCKQASYDISVITPQHQNALRKQLLRQTIEVAFQLKLHQETKLTDVFALRQVPQQEPRLKLSNRTEKAGYWNPRKGEAELTGASIETVLGIAKFVLAAQVLDETELKGRYDFDLHWDPRHPEALPRVFRDQLGLELVSEKRALVHLVVDSVTEPKTW